MMHPILMFLTARLPMREIEVGGQPYLQRYYVGTLFGVTFYLHRFLNEDSERHTHNHPWTWGRAIVLRGSYVESRVVDLWARGALTRRYRVRRYNVIDGSRFHRILHPEPNTWTLFFHGPRARVRLGGASVPKGWGFLEGQKFVPYDGTGAPTAWHKTAGVRGHD